MPDKEIILTVARPVFAYTEALEAENKLLKEQVQYLQQFAALETARADAAWRHADVIQRLDHDHVREIALLKEEAKLAVDEAANLRSEIEQEQSRSNRCYIQGKRDGYKQGREDTLSETVYKED